MTERLHHSNKTMRTSTSKFHPLRNPVPEIRPGKFHFDVGCSGFIAFDAEDSIDHREITFQSLDHIPRQVLVRTEPQNLPSVPGGIILFGNPFQFHLVGHGFRIKRLRLEDPGQHEITVGCGFVAEGPEMITVHRVNQPVRRNQPAAVLPPGLVTDLKDFLFMHAPEDGGDRVGIGFGASVPVQVFEQDFILGIPPSHRPVHGDQLLPAQVVQEEMGLFHVLFCLEFFSRHMHLARRVVIQGSLRTGFLVVSDQQRDILPRYPQCLTDLGRIESPVPEQPMVEQFEA